MKEVENDSIIRDTKFTSEKQDSDVFHKKNNEYFTDKDEIQQNSLNQIDKVFKWCSGLFNDSLQLLIFFLRTSMSSLGTEEINKLLYVIQDVLNSLYIQPPEEEQETHSCSNLTFINNKFEDQKGKEVKVILGVLWLLDKLILKVRDTPEEGLKDFDKSKYIDTVASLYRTYIQMIDKNKIYEAMTLITIVHSSEDNHIQKVTKYLINFYGIKLLYTVLDFYKRTYVDKLAATSAETTLFLSSPSAINIKTKTKEKELSRFTKAIPPTTSKDGGRVIITLFVIRCLEESRVLSRQKHLKMLFNTCVKILPSASPTKLSLFKIRSIKKSTSFPVLTKISRTTVSNGLVTEESVFMVLKIITSIIHSMNKETFEDVITDNEKNYVSVLRYAVNVFILNSIGNEKFGLSMNKSDIELLETPLVLLYEIFKKTSLLVEMKKGENNNGGIQFIPSENAETESAKITERFLSEDVTDMLTALRINKMLPLSSESIEKSYYVRKVLHSIVGRINIEKEKNIEVFMKKERDRMKKMLFLDVSEEDNENMSSTDKGNIKLDDTAKKFEIDRYDFAHIKDDKLYSSMVKEYHILMLEGCEEPHPITFQIYNHIIPFLELLEFNKFERRVLSDEILLSNFDKLLTEIQSYLTRLSGLITKCKLNSKLLEREEVTLCSVPLYYTEKCCNLICDMLCFFYRLNLSLISGQECEYNIHIDDEIVAKMTFILNKISGIVKMDNTDIIKNDSLFNDTIEIVILSIITILACGREVSSDLMTNNVLNSLKDLQLCYAPKAESMIKCCHKYLNTPSSEYVVDSEQLKEEEKYNTINLRGKTNNISLLLFHAEKIISEFVEDTSCLIPCVINYLSANVGNVFSLVADNKEKFNRLVIYPLLYDEFIKFANTYEGLNFNGIDEKKVLKKDDFNNCEPTDFTNKTDNNNKDQKLSQRQCMQNIVVNSLIQVYKACKKYEMLRRNISYNSKYHNSVLNERFLLLITFLDNVFAKTIMGQSKEEKEEEETKMIENEMSKTEYSITSRIEQFVDLEIILKTKIIISYQEKDKKQKVFTVTDVMCELSRFTKQLVFDTFKSYFDPGTNLTEEKNREKKRDSFCTHSDQCREYIQEQEDVSGNTGGIDIKNVFFLVQMVLNILKNSICVLYTLREDKPNAETENPETVERKDEDLSETTDVFHHNGLENSTQTDTMLQLLVTCSKELTNAMLLFLISISGNSRAKSLYFTNDAPDLKENSLDYMNIDSLTEYLQYLSTIDIDFDGKNEVGKSTSIFNLNDDLSFLIPTEESSLLLKSTIWAAWELISNYNKLWNNNEEYGRTGNTRYLKEIKEHSVCVMRTNNDKLSFNRMNQLTNIAFISLIVNNLVTSAGNTQNINLFDTLHKCDTDQNMSLEEILEGIFHFIFDELYILALFSRWTNKNCESDESIHLLNEKLSETIKILGNSLCSSFEIYTTQTPVSDGHISSINGNDNCCKYHVILDTLLDTVMVQLIRGENAFDEICSFVFLLDKFMGFRKLFFDGGQKTNSCYLPEKFSFLKKLVSTDMLLFSFDSFYMNPILKSHTILSQNTILEGLSEIVSLQKSDIPNVKEFMKSLDPRDVFDIVKYIISNPSLGALLEYIGTGKHNNSTEARNINEKNIFYAINILGCDKLFCSIEKSIIEGTIDMKVARGFIGNADIRHFIVLINSTDILFADIQLTSLISKMISNLTRVHIATLNDAILLCNKLSEIIHILLKFLFQNKIENKISEIECQNVSENTVGELLNNYLALIHTIIKLNPSLQEDVLNSGVMDVFFYGECIERLSNYYIKRLINFSLKLNDVVFNNIKVQLMNVVVMFRSAGKPEYSFETAISLRLLLTKFEYSDQIRLMLFSDDVIEETGYLISMIMNNYKGKTETEEEEKNTQIICCVLKPYINVLEKAETDYFITKFCSCTLSDTIKILFRYGWFRTFLLNYESVLNDNDRHRIFSIVTNDLLHLIPEYNEICEESNHFYSVLKTVLLRQKMENPKFCLASFVISFLSYNLSCFKAEDVGKYSTIITNVESIIKAFLPTFR